MPINFSGLASGLDTSSIIDALVSVERGRANVVEARKSTTERRISTIGNLTSLMTDMKLKLEDFSKANEIRQMAVESTNEDRILVETSGASTAGNFAMRVNSLAQFETTQSSTYAVADAGVVGAGSVDITVGSGDAVNIAYDENDSLYDIAERITNADAGVTGSVLFDGTDYRIMVSGEDSGDENAITFVDNGDSLGFSNPGAELISAADSSFTLNGVAITRPTNVIGDVIKGVTLNLTGVSQLGEADTQVVLSQDTTATQEKLQEFVDSYNKIQTLMTKEMSYSGVNKDEGSLFGDSTMRMLQRTLGEVVTSAYGNGAATTSLGMLGMELDNTGKLSIDSVKIKETLTSDPRAIDNIFAGNEGNDGIAKVLQDLVESYTQSGDGLLSAKTTALNSRIKVFDEQIERIETRANSVSEQLNKQFAALEQAMSQLNSQQSYLSAIGF